MIGGLCLLASSIAGMIVLIRKVPIAPGIGTGEFLKSSAILITRTQSYISNSAQVAQSTCATRMRVNEENKFWTTLQIYKRAYNFENKNSKANSDSMRIYFIGKNIMMASCNKYA